MKIAWLRKNLKKSHPQPREGVTNFNYDVGIDLEYAAEQGQELELKHKEHGISQE